MLYGSGNSARPIGKGMDDFLGDVVGEIGDTSASVSELQISNWWPALALYTECMENSQVEKILHAFMYLDRLVPRKDFDFCGLWKSVKRNVARLQANLRMTCMAPLYRAFCDQNAAALAGEGTLAFDPMAWIADSNLRLEQSTSFWSPEAEQAYYHNTDERSAVFRTERGVCDGRICKVRCMEEVGAEIYDRAPTLGEKEMKVDIMSLDVLWRYCDPGKVWPGPWHFVYMLLAVSVSVAVDS
ncbi:hypothetical protein BDZ88DRAFT_490742 [Geranomyces variabilis]|nr:hypothetical protein BDZ88DRAFT_490742 [Geranomyces variabilis]